MIFIVKYKEYRTVVLLHAKKQVIVCMVCKKYKQLIISQLQSTLSEIENKLEISKLNMR